MDRARSCLEQYQKIWLSCGVTKVSGVATSSVRDAANGQEFLDLAKDFGIDAQTISGSKEANLSFSGGLYGLGDLNPDECALIDIGGGSTEFVYKGQFQSLDIGSVRLSEKFNLQEPAGQQTLSELNLFIDEALKELTFDISNAKHLIAVAGTPTTLVCLIKEQDYAFDLVHGQSLASNQVGSWINKLSFLSGVQRCKIPFMPEGRGDVLLAGSSILLQSLKKFQFTQATVSCGGVRFGLASQLLNQTSAD